MNRRGSPVAETLVLVGSVYLFQQLLWIAGIGAVGMVALDASVGAQPWTVVTSVYAHAGLEHLLANAVGIVLFGALVARRTTRRRFHAFFLGTGALAGLAEVWISGLLGPSPAVLGASGAVFGLIGYLLAGNTASAWLLDRIGLAPRVQIAAGLLVAGALTLATASPGSALFGHATGLFVGLIAGRLELLDVSPSRASERVDQNTRTHR